MAGRERSCGGHQNACIRAARDAWDTVWSTGGKAHISSRTGRCTCTGHHHQAQVAGPGDVAGPEHAAGPGGACAQGTSTGGRACWCTCTGHHHQAQAAGPGDAFVHRSTSRSLSPPLQEQV
eukprot:scaffold119062_cov17-Tisochrysis_lutea.AAC.3